MEYLSSIILIAVSAALINNFVLHYFVGLCPYIGVSKRVDMAFGMGAAVTFVVCIAVLLSWLSVYFFLQKDAPAALWLVQQVSPQTQHVDLSILSYIVFILVIAASVQLVEMYVRKFAPALYKAFGVYLPLITTNCVILFACIYILNRVHNLPSSQQWDLGRSLALAFFAGVGFMLAIVIMAGIREELEFCDVPKPLRGAPITLITVGILSMAFFGFARVDANLERLLKPPAPPAAQVAPQAPAENPATAQPSVPAAQGGNP